MAKWQNDDMLDAALNYIKTNVVTQTLCNGMPADFTEATTVIGSGGKMIADVLVGSADVVLSGGDTSGRKATVAEKSSVTIDDTGSAINVALVSGDTLLYVTECVEQSLTAGNDVTIPAWDIEMRDAV